MFGRTRVCFRPKPAGNRAFLEPLQSLPESNLGKLAAPAKPPTATAVGYIRLRRPLNLSAPAIALPEGVEIATLMADDATRVHALLQAAYSTGFGTVPGARSTGGVAWSPTASTTATSPSSPRRGEDVIGFCPCWTSSFIKDLVVDVRWRNRGVGSALLSTAITALRARGAEEVALKVDIYNAARRSACTASSGLRRTEPPARSPQNEHPRFRGDEIVAARRAAIPSGWSRAARSAAPRPAGCPARCPGAGAGCGVSG